MTNRKKTIFKLQKKLSNISKDLKKSYSALLLVKYEKIKKNIEIQKCYLEVEND